MQENNSKVICLNNYLIDSIFAIQAYTKISKQLGSSALTGSFGPMLQTLKTSADKLAAVHSATLAKVLFRTANADRRAVSFRLAE